jgi:hypothetical protein
MNGMIQASQQDEAYDLSMSWVKPRLIVRTSSVRE